MSQTLITVEDPNAFIIKNVTDASFVLLTANFNTGVVSSAHLSARAVTVLTERLQDLLAKAPVLADIEAGFAGLVESLLCSTMFETGSFVVTTAYVAPTATMTLSGLTDPSHIGVTMPMSTSAPFIGVP